jgi:hypothetical protein
VTKSVLCVLRMLGADISTNVFVAFSVSTAAITHTSDDDDKLSIGDYDGDDGSFRTLS